MLSSPVVFSTQNRPGFTQDPHKYWAVRIPRAVSVMMKTLKTLVAKRGRDVAVFKEKPAQVCGASIKPLTQDYLEGNSFVSDCLQTQTFIEASLDTVRYHF